MTWRRRSPTLLQSLLSEPPNSSYRMRLSASPQSLRAWRWSSLLRNQKKFWIEEQAEANASKRAPQELAQSFAERRCTTKTQPPETIDLEPPDPTQGPSQTSHGGNLRIFWTSRHSLHNRTGQPPWPERRHHDLFWRKSVSTQRRRKHFLLVYYVNANSSSQKLWSFIRDRTKYPCRASSSHDQFSDQLRAVGWKLTEFTAARPSSRSATGTTGGAATLARSHLRELTAHWTL